MDRAPLFPQPGEHVTPEDFLRSYWCPHYNTCLEEAAANDLYLDCSNCAYKEKRVFDLSFEKCLPC
jgi:hypothetical protein